MINNPHIGSSFDDFLVEEGIYEEVNETAIKRVLVWEVEQFMKQHDLSKTAMAKQMNTSRAALDRLLDPDNDSITLHTLQRAARCVGKRLHLELA